MKDLDDDRPLASSMRDDLGQLLAQWRAPEVPRTLDDRLLRNYRHHVDQRPLWRRFLTASVSVPLPLAAAALLALAISVAYALRGTPEEVEVLHVERLEAPVITHTSLAGFEPVTQSDTTVVLGTSP